MAKCKPCECKKGLPLWLGTFGDLMSLLLCFFVLLLSMATFDAKKLTEAEASLNGALSILPGGTKFEKSRERMQQQTPITTNPEAAEVVNKIETTLVDYNEMIKITQGVSIMFDVGDEGFIIRLPAKVFFEPGSDVIKDDETLLFLRRIGQILAMLPSDVNIFVNGHTDNKEPPKESRFKDNWQLSAARALSVARELVNSGVAPKRVTPVGHGEYKSIATNDTKEGREKNNRVEINFFGKKAEQKSKSSILDR